MLPLAIRSYPSAVSVSSAAWAIAFDDAAVIANDLGNERKAESRAGRLRGDEGIEEMRHEVRRYPRAIVFDGDFEGETDARLASGNGKPDTRTERGRKRDLSVGSVFPDRLSGILHEIEEDLDELVPAPRHWR
jgi:hypothetical protein